MTNLTNLKNTDKIETLFNGKIVLESVQYVRNVISDEISHLSFKQQLGTATESDRKLFSFLNRNCKSRNSAMLQTMVSKIKVNNK